MILTPTHNVHQQALDHPPVGSDVFAAEIYYPPGADGVLKRVVAVPHHRAFI